MICFDREIPESVRCLRALGAEVVLCPLATDTFTFAGPRQSADNELFTSARAAENEVFIVVVNHAGRFNGGSFVCGPSGELLCQMGPEPGVQVVELALGAARKLQRNPLGWAGWGHRRQEIYDQYLK
jgi:N-carbamoylputrescine amidase